MTTTSLIVSGTLTAIPRIDVLDDESTTTDPQRSPTPSASGRLATKDETTLYRAVSDDELADVAKNGFRPGRNSMETKLFATSAEDAAQFGRANYGLDGKPFTLLRP